MTSAFDDDKDTSGERANVFDELDRKHGIRPLMPTTPAAAPGAPSSPTAASGFGEGLWNTAKKVGGTVDDAVRAAADTITFGLLDRGLEASGLEKGAIEKTTEARKQSPYATIAGDVAGAVGTVAATPLRAVGAGAAAALGGARAGLPGIAGRAAGYGAEGALVGGAQAAGHTYDWKDLPGNLAWGTGLGGIGGAVTGPFVSGASLAPRPRAEVPSPRDLKEATNLLYAAGRSNPAGVYHAGGAVRNQIDDIKQTLYDAGFHYKNAKNTFASLDEITKAQAQASRQGGAASFSPGNLESIRQAFNKSTKDPDIAASSIAKRMLDEFTANPTASGLSGGTVRGAQSADAIFETARGNAAANIRSKTLRDAAEEVDLRSAARYSGRNYENNMRGKIASILTSEGRSFPRAEREGLENLARRTDAWNTTREVGNMLGGGGGIGTWVAPAVLGGVAGGGTAYGTGGDPLSSSLAVAAPILAGRTLRGMSNRSMQRAVGEMDDIIRSNSPEFARRQAITPGTVTGPGMSSGALGTRDAVVESLIRREKEKREPLRITVGPRYP